MVFLLLVIYIDDSITWPEFKVLLHDGYTTCEKELSDFEIASRGDQNCTEEPKTLGEMFDCGKTRIGKIL